MRPSRQVITISAALIVAGSAAVWSVRSPDRGVDAGFWFEPVVFGDTEPMAERLGGPITADEMGTIERIAFSETMHAFEGFNISLTKSREAAYRMRVVQSLRVPFAPKMPPPSGESRAIGRRDQFSAAGQ